MNENANGRGNATVGPREHVKVTGFEGLDVKMPRRALRGFHPGRRRRRRKVYTLSF